MFICSFAVFHVEEGEEYSVWKSTDSEINYHLFMNSDKTWSQTTKIQLIHHNEKQWASQMVRVVKNLRANTGDGRDRCLFNPWIENIPWSRKWQRTPLFLPGKFREYRILVGHSPWVCRRVGHGLATDMESSSCGKVLSGTSPRIQAQTWPS